MPAYQLAFEETGVARIRPANDPSPEPLARFHMMWRPGTNEVETVHNYGHAPAISDHPWLGQASTIAEAVAFCDGLERRRAADADYDWSSGTIETNPGI